jgi:hypothetical protein
MHTRSQLGVINDAKNISPGSTALKADARGRRFASLSRPGLALSRTRREVTADLDAFYTDIKIDFGILPDAFFDEESVKGYSFRVQAITGGVPVTAKAHLVGSIPGHPRRVLRGSIRRSAHLIGSIGGSIGKTKPRRIGLQPAKLLARLFQLAAPERGQRRRAAGSPTRAWCSERAARSTPSSSPAVSSAHSPWRACVPCRHASAAFYAGQERAREERDAAEARARARHRAAAGAT